MDYWLKKGAQPSDTVRTLIARHLTAEAGCAAGGRRRNERSERRRGVRAVVEVLARALTDRPDDVRVVETEHKGTTLVELYVAPGDLGKVIGKQGRTAAALRTLAASAAERDGKTVTLEIRDGRPDEIADCRIAGLQEAKDLTNLLASLPLLQSCNSAILQSKDEMAGRRIARAHGIRGQVIVNLDTDFPRGAVSARAPSCSSNGTERFRR